MTQICGASPTTVVRLVATLTLSSAIKWCPRFINSSAVSDLPTPESQ